eukprot:scaffold421305_cov50-Attheya_sp.AAC.2
MLQIMNFGTLHGSRTGQEMFEPTKPRNTKLTETDDNQLERLSTIFAYDLFYIARKYALDCTGVCDQASRAATKGKRTTPGIPTWSPTVVLTGPEDA